MSFDQSLLLALYFLIIAMMLVLLAAWRLNQEVKGLREWFLGYLSAFINMTIFVMCPSMPAFAFMLINQTTLMATGFFAFKGCCQHANIQSRLEKIAIPIIAVSLLISAYFTAVENNLALRFLIGSLVSGLFCISGALYLLRTSFEQRRFQYLFGITLLAHGVFNSLRSILFMDSVKQFLQANAINPTDAILIEQILITSLLALGVLMMTNELISKELRSHAEQDSLTNMFNRRFFLKLLEKSKSLAVRTQKPLSLLVLDIDHFKLINDKFGHLAGDEVLISFAKNAQKNLRAEDVMGRIGGEEFAIFLPNTNGESAVFFAERLRRMIEAQPAPSSKGNIPYTISIGVTVIDKDTPIEQALDEADLTMYQAKRNGRNRVEYLVPPDKVQVAMTGS